MSEVRFKDQIRPQGLGKISFWGDDEGRTGCCFQIPLAPITDSLTDERPLESRLFIDSVTFIETEFQDSDELNGKEVEIETPEEDDPFRHGSHYICGCHNPITVRSIRFDVIDRDHMHATVDLTVHYDEHGLGDAVNLNLRCVLHNPESEI